MNIPMRTHILRFGTFALAAGLLTSAWYKIQPASLMSDTANAFLVSLAPEQAARAKFDFKDEERYFWHFIPSANIQKTYQRPRKGLPFLDMKPHQQQLAYALLSSALSQQGYIKATTIMSLEDVLRIQEKDTEARRDPMKYFFSIFGEPSEKGVWGMRVEGHHLSLHYVVVDGKVAASPTFFGDNPAEVREGPRKGLRALAREEDLGRDLLKALTPEQKKTAIVEAKAYNDILTSNNRTAALEGQPNGLAAAKMTPKQRELLTAVLTEYANNLPEPVAMARLAEVKKAGTNMFFAWAGAEEKGGPHYYRIQGPTFLVEYDNTQNGANHIHSVWRDKTGDFGEDLLKAHYAAAHTK